MQILARHISMCNQLQKKSHIIAVILTPYIRIFEIFNDIENTFITVPSLVTLKLNDNLIVERRLNEIMIC